jgi:hypothetical protein
VADLLVHRVSEEMVRALREREAEGAARRRKHREILAGGCPSWGSEALLTS